MSPEVAPEAGSDSGKKGGGLRPWLKGWVNPPMSPEDAASTESKQAENAAAAADRHARRQAALESVESQDGPGVVSADQRYKVNTGEIPAVQSDAKPEMPEQRDAA